MRPFTVAVLECDTPIDPVVEKYGTYGDIFERFLKKGLTRYTTTAAAPAPELKVNKSNMVEMGELPELDAIDCLLLSGSKHDSFDNDEWILRVINYVRRAHDTGHIPIVGICFGHQIIGRALGGDVQRSPGGWEVSVEQIDLTDNGVELFGAKSLSLHQMHHDAIRRLPHGAVNLGTSPSCGVQGLYIPGRLFSLQAHPEFNDEIMENILEVRHCQGVFSDTLFDDASRRAKGNHDGDLVGEVIWRFLLDGTK